MISLTFHQSLEISIYTDSWKGYNDIDEYFKHRIINHSKEFVNGNIHTQNIEATHSAVRRILRIDGSNSGNKELQFNEYVWRKKNQGKIDLFEKFIKDLSNLYTNPYCRNIPTKFLF